MHWVEIFAVFVVSHMVGDFVLQTDWQAVNKHGGLRPGNAVGRRALLTHCGTYTLAFAPCLVWLAGDLSWSVLIVAAALFFPHVVQDDGRVLARYMREVKKADPTKLPVVALGLDQSVHAVVLLLLAIAI